MGELASYYDPAADMSSEERRRRETCTSKATYSTQELAKAATIYAEWTTSDHASALMTYQCKYCRKWHLSSR